MLRHEPGFGRDGWLNDATRASALAGEPLLDGRGAASAALFLGADTIGADIGLLPDGLSMYASYVDNLGGYPELVARFGAHAPFLLLSITIFGNPARCADVELGAMSPADLPHWLDNVALTDGGQLPWVYSSAANFANCNEHIGDRQVVRWSAHYGFGPHVCGPATCGFPQADWTQWTDTGPAGQNFDRSIGTYLPGQPGPSPSYPVLGVGATGENVTTIQYLLIEQGYGVAVDGIFGPATRAGVVAFQSAHGLSPDGLVGPLTWPKLIVDVQRGSRGPAVSAVQSQLNARGNMLAVDGTFGAATAASVRAFQQRRGLAADGIVGPVTWLHLVGGP
jgi:hypothetical protein